MQMHLPFVLGEKLVADGRPYGNIAAHEIGDVIIACLVGLSDLAEPLVPRALDWLDRAIREDEEFGESPDFHRLTLQRAKAIGLWLRDAANAAATWGLARQYSEAALKDRKAYAPRKAAKRYLDDYMALCLQSEQFEFGIATFEKYWGPSQFSPARTPTPRKLGYALCLHKGRGLHNAEELFVAGRRMLRANLEETWVGSGQYIRAATWLKIVHWHRNPSLTPLQTILLAYEDMPHVPRPDFV
jgi:hypothetical protein